VTGPLSGRVSLVTGASSGIGEGLALRLSDLGSDVIVTARRRAELDRVARCVESRGVAAHVVPADLTRDDELRELVRVADDLGGVDVLVNSAGIIEHQPVHETDPASWDAVLATNLRAPALLCAALLPRMRARRSGWIVNVASEAGVRVYAGMGAYCVGKHALRVLTELVQDENQDHGIRAVAICPGYVAASDADRRSDAGSRMLTVADVADMVELVLTRPPRVKLGPEILIRTTENPYAPLGPSGGDDEERR
jgi:NAD(P)-dependent dehydrogenase (short-subunit alcohol dehydrogenase family)